MLYEGGFTEQMMVWRISYNFRKKEVIRFRGSHTDMDGRWCQWINEYLQQSSRWQPTCDDGRHNFYIMVRWSCALSFVFSTQCCRGLRVSVWHRDTLATTIFLIPLPYLFLFTMSTSTSIDIHEQWHWYWYMYLLHLQKQKWLDVAFPNI